MSKELDRPEKRLKVARIAAGFRTPTEFANTFNLNDKTYLAHERGPEHGRGLRRKVANEYAEMLDSTGRLSGITGDWLYYGSGEPPLEVLGDTPPREKPDGVSSEDQANFIISQSRTRTGDTTHPGPEKLDRDFMAAVIIATAEILEREGLRPRPGRLADLYLALYVLADKRRQDEGGDGNALDFSDLVDVMRLAS